jgi:hypothetical protein
MSILKQLDSVIVDRGADEEDTEVSQQDGNQPLDSDGR